MEMEGKEERRPECVTTSQRGNTQVPSHVKHNPEQKSQVHLVQKHEQMFTSLEPFRWNTAETLTWIILNPVYIMTNIF